tara:strand:- start:4626 stop:5246 length:621 start_codon:yes stop_codon:yes gene_type:complete
MTQSTKAHWNTIYQNKKATKVSWFQEKPAISLTFIAELGLEKSVAIIDVGGGESLLVDFLLAEGYTNITVLDISEKAIAKAKERLGNQAHKVQWIVSDVLDFTPKNTFDVWHDRAAFHFITAKNDVAKYLRVSNDAMTTKGTIILGTFSKTGPKKCSGIPIAQYSERELTSLFTPLFTKQSVLHHAHQTPFKTSQDFIFCSFKKAN